MNKPTIAVFGEVLFDNFPDGTQVLGGAPFNVAWHLQAFKQQVQFISRIGQDRAGQTILAKMNDWHMASNSLQIDAEHPTGQVAISLNDGEPSYQILDHQAYDYIQAAQINPDWHLLYHGSLALRNTVSRASLNDLKSKHTSKIFVDVNLRAPWWQIDLLAPYLQDAHWLKLNHEELSLIMAQTSDLASTMQLCLARFQLECLLVTLGAEGAIALTNAGEFVKVSVPKKQTVVDTVGAGDAFSAIVCLGIQHNWPLTIILERAQSFASAIVSRRGATVDEPGFYQKFILDWKLS